MNIRHSSIGFTGSDRENRLAYANAPSSAPAAPAAGGGGFMNTIKSAGSRTWGFLKKSKNFIWKASYLTGAPFVWWGLKKTWGAAKFGWGVSEEVVHRGVEGAKGVWKMTGETTWEFAKAPLRDIKISLWDVPKEVFKGIFRLPIAIAKSPMELAGGVRESLGALWNGAKETTGNLLEGRVWDAMKSTRKMVWTALAKPISRPLLPIIKPIWNVGAEVVHSKTQYINSLNAGRKKFAEGVRDFVSGILGGGTAAKAEKAPAAAR
ncbi:hypothetical protein JXA05_04605 [Candidatus Peregrinibacteria bacterium]|nr:hypothetical protein [Candidatus Peregrinibacteria bacterium]